MLFRSLLQHTFEHESVGNVENHTAGNAPVQRHVFKGHVSAAAEGDSIKLDISADVAGTQVKISSGGEEQIITVGTAWTDTKKYAAKAGTMTVYGNVNRFNCGKNGKKITGLDISHNTQLNLLFCEENDIPSLDISKNTHLEVRREIGRASCRERV